MPHELPKAYDPGAIEARWADFWVRERLFKAETPTAGAPAPEATSGRSASGRGSGAQGAPARPVFSLLLPPPNVTGRLHMGHMLNHTQMDIIVRWHRMRGFLTLWLPGTDHAGIATQMMVERQLASEGKSRQELGRDAFIQRVWEWKQLYGNAILDQMKRLGASVDWDRTYFTMDDDLSRAVREVFVRLHEEGLIYRGKYIVNWCPRCMTAISDLEVVHEEIKGKLYEIRYPLSGKPQGLKPQISAAAVGAPEGAPLQSGYTTAAAVGALRPEGLVGGGLKSSAGLEALPYRAPTYQGAPLQSEYITVATTRPETMLGDTAVAVHPRDERYLRLQGKTARLPLMEREIPIIADEWVNPEFGTGAVKVTPAHDANDFQIGQRHGLAQISVMDEAGRMNEQAGAYAGLDRFQARERILRDLQDRGLLAGVKDHEYAIGKCDRCKTVVEPRLSTQWFVKIGPLAEPAIRAVESGEVTIVPENYAKTYFEWMRNIHDWCISRQLWWGHRIPAWHCVSEACKNMVVAREAPARCSQCGGTRLEQDPDVLDTWFSSGLLPFTTLGWPEKTRDLDTFYPTSLLITAYEILFFWVARMIMMGCHFMAGHPQGSVPFRQVYIHALVRDAERQKMSKTKGNVLDPIEVIERYGTDAIRFTLAAMAAPGTDIAFSESRAQGYRAFANKIWNAARFMFMSVDRAEREGIWRLRDFQRLGMAAEFAGEGEPRGRDALADSRRDAGATAPLPAASAPKTLEDRWILSRFHRVAREVNQALAEYRFHEAAHLVYHFFWGEFCDWYIEMVKLRLSPAAAGESERQAAGQAFDHLMRVFEAALRLLSPFMPFITEELWQAIYDGRPPLKSIALAAYPQPDPSKIDDTAESEMAVLQDLIVSVRNIRAELKVDARERVPLRVFADAEVRRLVEQNRNPIEKLATVESIEFVDASLAQTASSRSSVRSTARFDVAVVYQQRVDAAAERQRLGRELKRLEGELSHSQRQLGNEQFLARAPTHVVEGIRRRSSELAVLVEKTRRALAELESH